jgi:hypothetical protein
MFRRVAGRPSFRGGNPHPDVDQDRQERKISCRDEQRASELLTLASSEETMPLSPPPSRVRLPLDGFS